MRHTCEVCGKPLFEDAIHTCTPKRTSVIDYISIWFEKVRKYPTKRDLSVQIGVHFEEVSEMIAELTSTDARTVERLEAAQDALVVLATHLKQSGDVSIVNRARMLDALCDQVVTATGVAHDAHMQILEGLRRVNAANYTKFENGDPVFDMHGKLRKGSNYVPANLEGLV